MARTKQPAKQPAPVAEEIEEVDDLGEEGVRNLEPEPEETEYTDQVQEAPQEPPATELTTTQTFFGGGQAGVTEIEEIEPEIIEGDEPTYKIRLIKDVESVFLGTKFRIPDLKKDVLYEVNKRIYDYLLPKGLIQGK